MAVCYCFLCVVIVFFLISSSINFFSLNTLLAWCIAAPKWIEVSGEALVQFVQRGGGCPIPANTQGQLDHALCTWLSCRRPCTIGPDGLWASLTAQRILWFCCLYPQREEIAGKPTKYCPKTFHPPTVHRQFLYLSCLCIVPIRAYGKEEMYRSAEKLFLTPILGCQKLRNKCWRKQGKVCPVQAVSFLKGKSKPE